MKKRKLVLLLTLMTLALCLTLSAQAEMAKGITPQCKWSSSYKSWLRRITDGKLNTPFEVPAGCEMYLQGEMQGKSVAGGLYVVWTKEPTPANVEVWDEAAKSWTLSGQCGHRGISREYVRLPDAKKFRIIPIAGNTLSICEIKVLSPGDELPDWVQDWQPAPQKADLMLISGHPDDEYIFFGGLLPYYASERKLSVAVCYLTWCGETRFNELLDGLWLAGVREFPLILELPDKFSMTLNKAYSLWDREDVLNRVQAAVEQVKPEVVVVHDLEGEYGHGAHRVTADAALALIRDGERPLAWQPKKLYLHLWEEDQLMLDWETPAASLGGQTPLERARDCFRCHKSQQGGDVTLKSGREYVFKVRSHDMFDNALFGLAYSSVGPDEAKNDLMEHIN